MEQTETMVVEYAQKILTQVRKAVVGKDSVLLWVLATVLAKGHILLEDIPGVGKTTMALAFSRALGLSHSRVQFTPDVLPSDVTGYSVLDQQTGQLVYKPGAVLCNLFLADELNRATSRTQSALLEAMEEGQVTVDGTSHKLPDCFTVIATQNPVGAAGTQLLPDSQIDRFMIRLSLGYPDPKDEVNMVLSRQDCDPLSTVETVVNTEKLQLLQKTVAATHVAPEIATYAVQLVDATRRSDTLLRGGSPRATLAVIALSKAVAQLQGRDYVVPKDVQEVFVEAVAHRVQVAPGQEETARQLLQRMLRSIPAPSLV
jgi:MoxR-like ATPase